MATDPILHDGKTPRTELEALRQMAGDLAGALDNLMSWFGPISGSGHATLPHGLPSSGAVNEARALLDRARAAGILT